MSADYLTLYPPERPETYHPECRRWSALPAEALAGLVEDIKEHGLLEPIAVQGGQIVDGRHRYLACIQAGVDPRFDELPPSMNASAYILSWNAHRRHASKRELAWMAALSSMDSRQGRPGKRGKNVPFSLSAAAVAYGVSRSYVKRVRGELKAHPDLLAAVQSEGLPYPDWLASFEKMHAP